MNTYQVFEVEVFYAKSKTFQHRFIGVKSDTIENAETLINEYKELRNINKFMYSKKFKSEEQFVMVLETI